MVGAHAKDIGPAIPAHALGRRGEEGDRQETIADDQSLAPAVSTADDADLTEGRLAAVLALSDLGRSVVGHYGFGAGADRMLPEWWRQ